MRDLYSDDYESVAGDGADRLIPDGVRRLAGAAVFLAPGRRRWASGPTGSAPATPREVPIIRAMEGPARVEPEDPGGAAGRPPGPRGQRRARRAAGAGAARRRCRRGPRRAPLTAEDAPQGELVLAAPAVLAERVLAEDGDLPMPGRRSLPPSSPRSSRTRMRPSSATPRCSRRRCPLPPPSRARAIARATSWSRRARTTPVGRTGEARRRAAPRGGARGLERRPGHAARPARRLRQRGDHPQGLGAARRPQRRPARDEEPLRRAHHRQRAGVLPAAGRRLRDRGADAPDVRGAAGARHRLHPGDAAVDGRARRHLRLRRPDARAGGARVLRRGRALGLHPLRPQRRDPGAAAAPDRGAARQRRARRAGADRPGGRPGRAAARRRSGATGRRRSTSASACPISPGARGRCTCATG